jgi:hypothetical protein
MALQYSPKIITDSLVMCLDASQNKSYPTDLPVKNGLVMWMDAADDTTFSYSSGTTVSQWRDKSGLNNHMVPISAGPTRSSALNSRKVLAFTTAQTIGSITFNMETSANTVFVVSRYTSSSTNTNRALTAYYNNWLLGHWGSQVNKYYAEGWVYLTTVTADTVWRMYMGDWSGSSTDLASFYSNGTELANGSAVATAGPKGLGINFQAGEPSTCEAAEIIVFNRVLSATERKQVHTYLGQKWGISNTDRSIIDLSNNNNNGLLGGVAGSQVVADMPLFDVYNKGALKFDGSSDYLSVTDNFVLNPVTVTVSMWLKRNAYQSSICNFLRRNDRDAYALMATNNTDTVWFRIRNSLAAVVDATTTMPLNTWVNLVGTFDGSNVRIYKDGVLANTNANTSPISYSGSTLGDLIIARDDIVSGRYAPINVGSTLIYSRALSATEISQNYEAQKSKFANTIVQQGLVLNLDAGNNYSYAGAGTTFYDVSGNSNNGTLTNGPTYSSDVGGAIVFDGTNDYVSIPDINFTAATIDIWVYINAYDVGGSVFVYQSSSGFEVWSDLNGLIRYNKNSSAGLTSGPGFTLNSWNNIVVTSDGTINKLYLNNVNIGSTNGVIFDNTAGDIRISGYGSYMVNGKCAMLKMYNRALSVTEITQNYEATKTRFGL